MCFCLGVWTDKIKCLSFRLQARIRPLVVAAAKNVPSLDQHVVDTISPSANVATLKTSSLKSSSRPETETTLRRQR